MKFEIGKKYMHETGMLLSVVGELETTWWGKTLIGEMISLSRDDNDKTATGNIELIAINDDVKLFRDWKKISNRKWLSYFEGQAEAETEIDE